MTHTAHSGLALPTIGLGTYNLRGMAGADAVAAALAGGYRLVDSAFNYENEAAVAEGVRRSGVDRADVLFTSKLAGRHHSPEAARTAIEESVLRTGLGHVDLLLIHWPNPSQGLYVDAWKALIDARERGLVSHIGVSNFLPEHLDALEEATGVLPAVNQIELHPYFGNDRARSASLEHDIRIEAWSPIAQGKVIDDAVLTRIGERHGKTASQVALRWHLQRDHIIFPKSLRRERMQENLEILDFALSADEMAEVGALDQGADGRIGPDPDTF